MINKVMQTVQFILIVIAFVAGGFVVYKGYQIHRAMQDRVTQIDEWIKRFINREKDWSRCEDRLQQLESKIYNAKTEQKLDEDSVLVTPSRPTVILYSIPGCEPCERWWRETATQWINQGWDVKRKSSATKQPTPYFDVYDGDKWFRVNELLTLESYRNAGGR